MSDTQRRFRFGVQNRSAPSRTDWVAQARKAEALGYDVFLMPDHLAGEFATGPGLAAAAAATSTIRLATLVLQNDLRHPALVAQEAATLDILSDGRYELGLGAGGSLPHDYETTGIPFDPPGVRMERLEESVTVVKGLFAEGPFSFSGKHYTITELDGRPKPVQRPHPPILLGGGGPRMLRLAAREADIVSIFARLLPGGGFQLDELPAAAIARKVDLLRQEAGERFPHVELNVLVQAVIVTDDRNAGIEQMQQRWAGIPTEHWLDSPHVLIGSSTQIAEQLRRYREQLGLSYYIVFADQLDTFAPVVAELSGR